MNNRNYPLRELFTRRPCGSLKVENHLGHPLPDLTEGMLGRGASLTSTTYPYKEDGILPDGSKVPDIPFLNLLIVRRDLRKGLIGESVVDTGFDAGIYANLNLVEFLEGLRPIRTAPLQAAGHRVTCEIFDVECHIIDQHSKPLLRLGRIEAYCPVDPIDLSEDVIVGRAMLNRLRLELNGKTTRLFV